MSSLSSLGSSLSVNGLITGLDTDKILQGLLAVKQAQISRLETKQKGVLTEQTAFKGVEARLVTLQSAISGLSRSQGGVFDGRSATSGNTDILDAAATSSATAGSYSFRVSALARSHAVASQGFDSTVDTITQGTLQIATGGNTTTITVDNTNNNLQGLVNAINASGAGVSASIVNDGRGHPYRLLLTSTKTGTANSITITNNLAASGGGAVRPDFASKSLGTAVAATANTSTSVATSGGTYTGTANGTYTFTVTNAGTVGTDNGITLSYSDTSGSHTGTITLNAADVNTLKTADEGVQIQFAAGTLVVGDKFTIDTSVPTIQNAADAQVTLGSGSGALNITSSNNTIDGIVPGLSLQLKQADPTKDVSVSVSNDIAGARQAIQSFVDSYNDLIETINDQVRFDAATNKAGTLLGNRQVTEIQDRVRSTVTAAVPGLSSAINRLGALGITTNDQGTLSVDSAKLDNALNGRTAGVTFADVRRLFNLSGTSTQSAVQFVTGSIRTNAEGKTIQVDITQAARQASITATNSLTSTTTIDGTNNTLIVKIDGLTSSTITIASGTYSRAALAQAIQSGINANSSLFGHQVAATLDGTKLKVTSAIYGSGSEVTVTGGTSLTALGFVGTETGKGQDVVGKFLVDGNVETAIGSGQFLIGNTGNTTTADLQVRVTLADSQLDAINPEANLTVTRGIASRLDLVLNTLLDPISGRIKSISDTYQSRIDDLKKTSETQSLLYESKRQALLKQFVALESTVGQLRRTGDFLTAQTNSLRNLSGR